MDCGGRGERRRNELGMLLLLLRLRLVSARRERRRRCGRSGVGNIVVQEEKGDGRGSWVGGGWELV